MVGALAGAVYGGGGGGGGDDAASDAGSGGGGGGGGGGGSAAEERTALDRRLHSNGGRVTAGFWTQLRVFTWRAARQLQRELGGALRNALIVCIGGVLLGFLFEGPFEAARCDSTASRLKLPAAASAAFVSACRNQTAEGGSFARARFYCFGSHATDSQLDGLDEAQFFELNGAYVQALTLAVLAVAIISMQLSLNLFGAERPVYFRESRHYSVAAYCLGKNVAQLPLSLLYPFLFLAFYYQLLRPYSPFQAFYVVFALVHWAGEGLGQLISIQLTSSRQLAGGVMALVCTTFTGSFPLLQSLPSVFTALSYASFCRWGMAALLGLEYAPWYVGDLAHTPAHPHHHCCGDAFPSGGGGPGGGGGPAGPAGPAGPGGVDGGGSEWRLPAGCAAGPQPGSRAAVREVLAETYGYTKWMETTPDGKAAPDVAFGRWGGPPQATGMLLALGFVFRLLVYASLVLKDRRARR